MSQNGCALHMVFAEKIKDHEVRLRAVESLAARVIGAALFGALVGGGAVSAFITQLFRGP